MPFPIQAAQRSNPYLQPINNRIALQPPEERRIVEQEENICDTITIIAGGILGFTCLVAPIYILVTALVLSTRSDKQSLTASALLATIGPVVSYILSGIVLCAIAARQARRSRPIDLVEIRVNQQ